MKILAWILGIAVAFVAIVWLAFQLSPWPAVLLIRRGFDKGAAEASQALEKHVPAGVSELRNETYDASDPDRHLDVFFPSDVKNSDRTLMTVVWIHGGAWISGTKDQIANDANQLSRYRYILFVDDVPVDLAGARCGTTASASGTFPCTAPLPRMQPGPHRLQLAVEETDKEKRRSPKSGAIFLDVAAPKIP